MRTDKHPLHTDSAATEVCENTAQGTNSIYGAKVQHAKNTAPPQRRHIHIIFPFFCVNIDMHKSENGGVTITCFA